MTEHGTVVKCKNNFIQVRIGRTSACAACGKCGMTESQKSVDFLVENTLDAKENDVVEVEIPEGNSASLAFVAYIIPLLPALLLMFVGFALKLPEWASLLMFVGGFALGFGIVALIDKVRRHKWMTSPVLKAVVTVSQSNQSSVEQFEPSDGNNN